MSMPAAAAMNSQLCPNRGVTRLAMRSTISRNDTGPLPEVALKYSAVLVPADKHRYHWRS